MFSDIEKILFLLQRVFLIDNIFNVHINIKKQATM